MANAAHVTTNRDILASDVEFLRDISKYAVARGDDNLGKPLVNAFLVDDLEESQIGAILALFVDTASVGPTI